MLVTLGERAFADGLAVRDEWLRDAGLRVTAERNRHALHTLPPASELEAAWPDLSIARRREIIGRVIDCVVVEPGRRHYDERIWLCPTGTAPQGLSRAGDRHARIRSMQPRRGWVSARHATDRPPRWTHARLERELRAFVAGRRQWPRAEHFHAAGRGRLHRQMTLQGGAPYWAAHLGLPRHARQRPRRWTDTEIRAALGAFLIGRTTWPPLREFTDAGRSDLRAAISRSGGVRRWATEFGLERHHHGQAPYWTEERITAELARLCEGRSTFPSRTDFERSGLGGMLQAMARRGQMARWVQSTGLPRQPNARRAAPSPRRS